MNALRKWFVLSSATMACCVTHAGIFETHTFDSFSGDPALRIPDGTPVGVSDTRVLTSEIGWITAVSVSIETSGEYNGDLYAYLRHGTGFSVLLNRVGVGDGDAYGYADGGFDVEFSDDAANGDIHLYRTISAPELGSPVTGLWAPDGRNLDPWSPAGDLGGAPRTATLSVFEGGGGSGEWTLFLADMSGGGDMALEKWELEIQGDAVSPVPEPRGVAMMVGVGLLLFAVVRRR